MLWAVAQLIRARGFDALGTAARTTHGQPIIDQLIVGSAPLPPEAVYLADGFRPQGSC